MESQWAGKCRTAGVWAAVNTCNQPRTGSWVLSSSVWNHVRRGSSSKRPMECVRNGRGCCTTWRDPGVGVPAVAQATESVAGCGGWAPTTSNARLTPSCTRPEPQACAAMVAPPWWRRPGARRRAGGIAHMQLVGRRVGAGARRVAGSRVEMRAGGDGAAKLDRARIIHPTRAPAAGRSAIESAPAVAQGLKRFQLRSHLASDTHRAALHPGHRRAIAGQRCNQPADFPATTAPKLHSSCTCLPSGKRSPGTPGLSTAKYVMPISLPLKHQNLFFRSSLTTRSVLMTSRRPRATTTNNETPSRPSD